MTNTLPASNAPTFPWRPDARIVRIDVTDWTYPVSGVKYLVRPLNMTDADWQLLDRHLGQWVIGWAPACQAWGLTEELLRPAVLALDCAAVTVTTKQDGHGDFPRKKLAEARDLITAAAKLRLAVGDKIAQERYGVTLRTGDARPFLRSVAA